VILVDSSVWVDYFRGVATPQTEGLERLLGQEPLGIGDLMLAEVPQGFRRRPRLQLRAAPVFGARGGGDRWGRSCSSGGEEFPGATKAPHHDPQDHQWPDRDALH
jgi:hypothetical protein